MGMNVGSGSGSGGGGQSGNNGSGLDNSLANFFQGAQDGTQNSATEYANSELDDNTLAGYEPVYTSDYQIPTSPGDNGGDPNQYINVQDYNPGDNSGSSDNSSVDTYNGDGGDDGGGDDSGD